MVRQRCACGGRRRKGEAQCWLCRREPCPRCETKDHVVLDLSYGKPTGWWLCSGLHGGCGRIFKVVAGVVEVWDNRPSSGAEKNLS